jgi:predicted lipoprotein with Yx(FWY)xxD motif
MGVSAEPARAHASCREHPLFVQRHIGMVSPACTQVAAAWGIPDLERMMSPMHVGSYLVVASLLAGCARGDERVDTLSSSGAVAESAQSPIAPATAAISGGPYDSTGVAGAGGAIATASVPSVGRYLTDARGRALYIFEKDHANSSSCTGACATAWPPFVGTATTTDSSVSAAKIGTITRSDQTKQTTYAGMPLYYYHDDAGPGDIKGQDKDEFGGDWYLVSPAGKKIERHVR